VIIELHLTLNRNAVFFARLSKTLMYTQSAGLLCEIAQRQLLLRLLESKIVLQRGIEWVDR